MRPLYRCNTDKATGRRSDRLARAAKARDGWRCTACGRPGKLEAHHEVPLSDGGADSLDNLATLCRGCHLAVHRRPLGPREAAWRSLVEELL